MGAKISYYCPGCGDSVWAYSGFEGNTCWGCKMSAPISNKGSWSNVMSHAPKISQFDFRDYYNKNGDEVVVICGGQRYQFKNVLPRKKWDNMIQRFKKVKDSENYTCGLNAINMVKCFQNHKNLMTIDNYSHKYIGTAKWGMSGTEFYNYNIKNQFKYHGYDYQEKLFLGGIDFRWGVIDNTDYTLYSLICLGGYGLGGHYFLLIGVDTNKQHYLVTDQNKDVWVADTKILRTACLYANNGYIQHSLYKVG